MNPRPVLRSLTREPGHALAVVLTLGLGIGATTAIFSLVSGVLLRPLPYPEAERIVVLHHRAQALGGDDFAFSFIEIADLRERSVALDEIVEYGDWTFSVLGRGDPHRANGGLVTANFFEILGMRPHLGRLLEESDRARDAAPVAVLTYDYWLRRCGGDPGIVGQPLDLTTSSATIVGVLTPGAHYATTRGQDFYVNYAANDHYSGASMQEERGHRMTNVMARLASGVEPEAARAELASVHAALAGAYPEDYPEDLGLTISLTPWREELTRDARPMLVLLLGTAGFVFLVACANVANLTLARASRREQELATRLALGARVAGLRGLLLAETGVLAAAGAILGLAIAYVGLDLLVAYVSRFTARTGEIGVDGNVLGFTIAIAAVAAMACAMVPRVRPAGPLSEVLAGGAGHATHRSGARVLQRALVVGQIALSFVLLVGAGLLLRTLANLYAVDPGFRLDDVLSLEAPKFTSISPEETRLFEEQLVAAVEASPSVESAALAAQTPLGTARPFALLIRVEGEPEPRMPTPTLFEGVTPNYFATLGIPLLQGRAFDRSDTADAPPVAIVNEPMARHYLGDGPALGRRIAFSFGGGWSPWIEVVGVVAATRTTAVTDTGVHAIYRPSGQSFGSESVLVRMSETGAGATPHVIESVRNLDPERPIEHIRTLAEARAESIAPQRLNATLFAAFAAFGMIIAAIGVGSVLGLSVSRRRRELGIRGALGADAGSLLRLVVRDGMVLTLIGLGLGAVGALPLARTLEGMLFDVGALDPATWLGVGALLATVALVACLLPAGRAARVPPAEALRGE